MDDAPPCTQVLMQILMAVVTVHQVTSQFFFLDHPRSDIFFCFFFDKTYDYICIYTYICYTFGIYGSYSNSYSAVFGCGYTFTDQILWSHRSMSLVSSIWTILIRTDFGHVQVCTLCFYSNGPHQRLAWATFRAHNLHLTGAKCRE